MSNTSKYDVGNGIHRVPLWRIGGFALNNTATNFYLMLMSFVSYYLTGFVGVAVVLASSFSTLMRLWDGVTDPIVGLVVDKTNGRFGKNRPFMVIGNAILCISSFILFHVTHLLPQNTILRFVFFTIVSAIYYVGYTCQCVVTKSAQSCLTNDPKQRPLFAIFDGVYNGILFTVINLLSASLSAKHGGVETAGFFHDFWLICACFSAAFTAIAVFSIAPKDNSNYFGTGTTAKVGLKDYWDCIKNNRAIQMLIVSASTDKLATQAKTSTVTLVLFAIVAGNYGLSGILQGICQVPGLILMIFVVGSIATTLGQRKAMLIGSWGGIVINSLLILLWIFGDATTMNNGSGGLAWSFFTIAYVCLTVLQTGFNGISGNIVIPMTADCADYEVYRSGKYLPGMMGTLFSFVDKLISSAAPMIAGLLFAAIGFTEHLPDVKTPYSTDLHYVAVFLCYGMVIIGLICNVIALKFYPLTKEKMEEIQGEIAAIKAKAMAGEE